MTRRFISVGVVLLLASLLLAACGIPQEDLDTAVAERDTARTQATSLQGDLTQAQNEIVSLESDLESAQSQIATTQNLLETTQSTLATTESDLADAESQASSLQSQVSSLQSTSSKASSDLAAIQEVYPPRHFTSATELRQWLAANAISDMPASSVAETLVDKTLQLQEAALEDGYIISLDIDEDPDFFYVNALALIGGLIWIIDVETDEVYQWSSLGAIR